VVWKYKGFSDSLAFCQEVAISGKESGSLCFAFSFEARSNNKATVILRAEAIVQVSVTTRK
jgi:hypothetical protein